MVDAATIVWTASSSSLIFAKTRRGTEIPGRTVFLTSRIGAAIAEAGTVETVSRRCGSRTTTSAVIGSSSERTRGSNAVMSSKQGVITGTK